MANLKPNMISSCRKWASSSTDKTASVSIASYGKNLLFKLFLAVFITYNYNNGLESFCLQKHSTYYDNNPAKFLTTNIQQFKAFLKPNSEGL